MKAVFCFHLLLFITNLAVCQGEISDAKFSNDPRFGFIENKGQIIDQFYMPNPGVLYLLNTPGLNVQLRQTGFSYDLYRIIDQIEGNRQKTLGTSSSTVTRYPSHDNTPVIKYNRIDFDLLNTDTAFTIIPFDPDSDYRNYYTDGLPVMGITNVRSFSSILYKNIYPGTDLQFIRDEKNSFKYNFILHPGADPERIRLRIKGASIVVNPSGSLRLETELGIIEEKIPECYYEIDERKFPVGCSFKKLSDSEFGFTFNSEIPLLARVVIDPTPTRIWGTYYGGLNQESAEGCAVDEDGNVFITGRTNSPDNIATAGAFQSTFPGINNNAFFVKFSPAGIRQWGTYYGGNGGAEGNSCTVDKAGNLYVAGKAWTGSNVATPGCFQGTCGGSSDVYLAKFTTNGYRIWSTFYGGEGSDGNAFCKTDLNCNVFICFYAMSDSLATPGTYMDYPYSIPDCILAEFDSTGQRKWATYFGGEANELIWSCTPDNYGYVYLSGWTFSLTNIATPGAHQQYMAGQGDCFLARFDTTGQLEWATYYGGPGADFNGYCSAAVSGDVYLCGSTASANNISTPGSHQENYGGGALDAFLVKFDSSGIRQWSTYYGGTGMDHGLAVTADVNGNMLMCGSTESNGNIATSGAYQLDKLGQTDAFLVKFTPNGVRLWGTYYGGSIIDSGNDLCTDVNTNIYMTGQTNSPDFIASANGEQTFLGGANDAYLVKFEDCPIPSVAGVISGPNSICIPQTGVVYTVPVINYATGYVWSVPSGCTIVSGFNTNSITVNFGPSAVNGKISVFGTDTCAVGASSSIDIFITPGNPVSISITVSEDTICANSSVVFTATPVNGGTTPSYQWKVNGITAGSNNSIFTYTPLNGDCVVCSVTSNDACAIGNPATSNQICMTVYQVHPVSLNITSTSTHICAGTPVTFDAFPTNPGNSPVYQWKVNGTNSGTNSQVFTYTPANGDCITCQLTSDISCPTGNPALSNSICMTVDQPLPVSVTVTTPQTTVCAGTTVTFTANPTHGGSLPGYQWKVNAVNVINATNASYAYNAGNGDVVTCELTSSETCVTGNPALSPPVTMTVTPNPAVTVSITPSANPFCPGSLVTFIAVPNHGGLFPAYLWKVNGSNTGTNSSSFTYAPLNGDVVICELISSDNCVTGNPATSVPVTMTASPVLAVTVVIAASSNPFCAGSQITFTSNAGNAGGSPGYQWKVNAINATNATNASYTYVPANGDQVSCILNSSESCITGNPALSNTIAMTVNTNLPAGVSISTPTNPFCPGTAVTFTANPANGGPSPSYQWKLNGVNAGANSTTFTCNPAVGDSIRCVITSNLNCVTGNPASSGRIIMSGNPVPDVSFTACFDTVTILGAQPFILHGGLPPGGQYSGPGVNSIAGTFTPSVAGTGLKTITYGYSNVYTCLATKTKTIQVQPNPAFTCGSNLTDIRDGKVYPTVQIGSQCWMASNLDFGFTISDLTAQTDNCVSEKYTDHSSFVTRHSSFYQWDELMRYDLTPGSQGLCPPGWHVPTEADWTTLFNFYLGSGQAGKPLQDTLISGLKAQTNGVFYLNSSWSFNGFATFFWTSTPWNAVKAISHGMNVYDYSVSLYQSSRGNAFSVRCLRD